MKKFILLCLFFICTNAINVHGQSTPIEKVLFVGNSYTYFWNLPQHVELMAASQDISLKARQSTAGGVHFRDHWKGERGLETIKKIETGRYDAVVLQNNSRGAIDRLDSMIIYGQKLAKKIKESGARVFLYQTWTREFDPSMQGAITEGYRALAEKTSATVVPVGLAFERARKLKPALKLYMSDGSHPSNTGTYLAACVFHGVLTGKSPIGLPAYLMTTDKDGQKLYIAIESREIADFCQKVAEDIINENID